MTRQLLAAAAPLGDDDQMGTPAEQSRLHTVTRLRDACGIAHRLTRTYSELAKRGRLGRATAWAAYPLMWTAYLGITSLEASSTVFSGVASLIAPNPVGRPRRRLWRGVAFVFVLAVAVEILLTRTPTAVRAATGVVGAACAVAWIVEMRLVWRISGKAGPLRSTHKRVQGLVDGPVVRGGTFGAWPHPSHQFGPLLDDVLDELRRDGISLLVQARDDELAATYVRHGAVQPDPNQPRHVLWHAGHHRIAS